MEKHREIFVAEVLGTGTLILLGDGVVAGVLLTRSKAQNSGWIVITMAWAFAVFCGVLVAGPISGAHLNPAVTFGDRAERWRSARDLAVVYWAAELLGAFIGAVIVFLHYYPHWARDGGRGPQAGRVQHRPSDPQQPWNLVSEIIGTFVLMFVIFTSSARRGHAARPRLGALPVAFLVLVIGLALGGTTGYAINPARDLGPRVAHFLLPIPGKRDSDWALRVGPGRRADASAPRSPGSSTTSWSPNYMVMSWRVGPTAHPDGAPRRAVTT